MRAVVVLILGLMAILLMTGCEERQEALCDDCNVILISIDTLRADHLGVYGSTRDVSPNIDGLAAEGFRFMDHYSQSPFTEPSHMSIFTSLYPGEHRLCAIGVADPGCRYTLSKDIPTLAEVLQGSGYATLGYVNAFNVHGNYGFGRGFDSYENFFGLDDLARMEDPAGEIIGKAGGRPFFVFLHTYTVHDPYFPDENVMERFCGGYEGQVFSSFKEEVEMMLDMLGQDPGSEFSRLFFGSLPSRLNDDTPLHTVLAAVLEEGYSEENVLRIVSILREFNEGNVSFEWPVVMRDLAPGERLDYPGEVVDYMREVVLPEIVSRNPEDLGQLECLYDAEISEVDSRIGKLFSSLKEHGLWDNTIIIVTSDHGEEFLEHGSLYHIKLYDEILRVPLLMRIPGATPEEVRITSATRNIDIFPTVLELLGISSDLHLSGASLVPLMSGETFNPYPFYSELLSVSYSAIISLEGTTYKVYLEGDDWLLFDLDEDPSEQEDLAGTMPDVEGKLRDLLAWHIEDITSAPGFSDQDEPWLDDVDPWNERRNELRALGYL